MSSTPATLDAPAGANNFFARQGYYAVDALRRETAANTLQTLTGVGVVFNPRQAADDEKRDELEDAITVKTIALAELQYRVRRQQGAFIANRHTEIADFNVDARRGIVRTAEPVFILAECSSAVASEISQYSIAVAAWEKQRDERLAAVQRAHTGSEKTDPDQRKERERERQRDAALLAVPAVGAAPLPPFPRAEQFFPTVGLLARGSEAIRLASGEPVLALPATPMFRYTYRIKAAEAARFLGPVLGAQAAAAAMLFARGGSKAINVTASKETGVRFIEKIPSETPVLLTTRAPALYEAIDGSTNFADVEKAARLIAGEVLDAPPITRAEFFETPFIVPIGTGPVVRRVEWRFDGNGARTNWHGGLTPKANKLKGLAR